MYYPTNTERYFCDLAVGSSFNITHSFTYKQFVKTSQTTALSDEGYSYSFQNTYLVWEVY